MTGKLPEPLIQLIEGRNFAFVATLMRDGWPQVTPVWIDHEGDLIVFNTAIGRVKQKNLARDPRTALALVDWNNPYHRAEVRGRVVEQTTSGAEEHIDKLAKKYLGVDKYSRVPGEKRIIIKIRPESIRIR
mgnify:CR=1 FL=1